jgi:hypothetical protein
MLKINAKCLQSFVDIDFAQFSSETIKLSAAKGHRH